MAHRKRKIINYAFIDSQNLNLGVGSNVAIKDRTVYYGWRLDFAKFYQYLRDELHVDRAFLFIGYTEEQEDLYNTLHSYGYSVVLKPTTSHKDAEGSTVIKGNVDTDLVLYAAGKEFNNYDKAVVVSGDGDFLSLYEYLHEKGKLGQIVIPNKLRYSQLLNQFADKLLFVSPNRKNLQTDQTTPSDHSSEAQPQHASTQKISTQESQNQNPHKPRPKKHFWRKSK